MSQHPAPTASLHGFVERVVYHTEDTGYCILKVLPEGHREPMSLIGKAPRVVAGEQFDMRRIDRMCGQSGKPGDHCAGRA